MYMIEYAKLQEVISSIQICFDPKDDESLIEEDKLLLNQYFEFEKMINNNVDTMDNNKEKSKWV